MCYKTANQLSIEYNYVNNNSVFRSFVAREVSEAFGNERGAKDKVLHHWFG